jgi:di/tricarboxylate transporter
MGGALTMVGNSPLILLNDLLLAANANLPSGAATLEPLKMFTPLPIGLALLAASLAYFHFFGDKQLGDEDGKGATPARTQSYFAKAYGIDGEVYELTVTADSPLVGMSLGEAEALHSAPLLLALKTGEESRLAPPADERIWVGSVIGAMGTRQQVSDFAQNHLLRLSSRLRNFADLFNPSRAGISEAVIPATSQFIGKTGRDLQLRKQMGLSLLAVNRDKTVLRENVRDVSLRAGDMLVFHSIWTDLAEAAESKDLVVVTDYPKGEQRPHKFKIAMAIFAVSMLLALSSRLPVSIALMTGVAGMLVAGVLHIDEAYAAINWKTVFLMACLIPLGWAMDSSGAAAWIAGHSVERLPSGTPGMAAGTGAGAADDGVLAGDQPCRRNHRRRAPRGEPGVGGRRQPDGVRADRGAVGVQQLHDRIQSGDLDDHGPGRLHGQGTVEDRRAAVADLHAGDRADGQPAVLSGCRGARPVPPMKDRGDFTTGAAVPPAPAGTPG